MTPVRRWLVVALVVVAVATPATVIRLWPASGSDLTATRLRDRIAASASRSWSGEVHAQGSLAVPDSESFGNVARLLGEDSDLRAWWVDGEHWRVDRIRPTGESDLVREGDFLTRWEFESARAVLTPYAAIRLPDESDLLPSTLARRVLSGSHRSELSRLPSRRVAGHDSAGLRLVPSDERSTIKRVDVWADQATGLPTRVDVYAAGKRIPILSTALTSLTMKRPKDSQVTFVAPPGVESSRRQAIDTAAGANAFAPFRMPDEVAGLARRGDPGDFGAVGVYGRGPTAVVVIPLRYNIASQLAKQLRKSKSSHETPNGVALESGPLSVMVHEADRGVVLIAGTVVPEALEDAADDVDAGIEVTQR